MDLGRIERGVVAIGVGLIVGALWFIICELGFIIFYLKEIESAARRLCIW